jgi:2-polyprenyl-6-methoxyphenol hydroxylase-like FAD-dependent oxidoreductase
MRMYYNDKLVVHQKINDVAIPGNKYPFMLVLPQSRTEAILRDALREKGIEVEVGTELKDIKQENGKVQTQIIKNEAVKDEEYDIVFAADGARSTIRKKLNVPFDGTTFKPLMYLSDYEIPTLKDD